MVNRQTSSPWVASHAPAPQAPSGGRNAPDPPALPRRRGRTLAIVLGVLVLLGVGARLTWSWLDPFGETTIDRSGPALLRSIHDLSRFEAASGDFQVIVDLEKDAPFLPDAIKGSRTLFVGAGSVDAYVDFSGLAKDAITVSPDGGTVTVRIPRAQLEKANIDNARSYVFAHERGLLDRLEEFFSSSPHDQRELYVLAEQKIAEAAAASDLRERADRNTRAMLEGMLRSLGFTNMIIEHAGAP
jgi:hypothetical protein